MSQQTTPGGRMELSCRDVGVDCDFTASGGTVQEIIEACVEHAKGNHGMKGFDTDLYHRMRSHIRTVPA